jgi:hypothetical protein
MITEKIKKDIVKIFENTPEDVSVGFGRKTINDIQTEELCILLFVKEKKPLSELSPEEVLPKTFEIDGDVYITDVQETGEALAAVCDSNTLNNCYGWQTTLPINRNYYNPIQGGMTITTDDCCIGTMGFVAVDNNN